MLDSVLEAVFDPAWNAAHRETIWSSIVTVLFLSGVGLPFPEDIPLMASGFTTFKQANDHIVPTRYLLTFVVVCVPILLGDLCAYALGRRFGWVLRDRFRFIGRLFTDARMERVRRWFERYGSFTVFLGRQVAGARFVTFYSAGTMRMSIRKFVFWDFLGCLVSVPVWLTLGTLAARYGRTWLEAMSSKVGLGFLIAVAVLALGLVLYARRRDRSEPDSARGDRP